MEDLVFEKAFYVSPDSNEKYIDIPQELPSFPNLTVLDEI